jgi:hypothetical protein
MGAWTRVQSAGGASGTTSSASLTGVTVGNLLVLAGLTGSGSDFSSVSDTHNTWHALAHANSNVSTIWYTIVTTGGSLTITTGSGSFSAICVTEFSPGGGTITTDGTSSGATGSSTAGSTGAITLTATDLAVGAIGEIGSGTGYTDAGGYTHDPNSVNYVGGTHYGVALVYNLTATTPTTPQVTLNSSTTWYGVGAAFTSTGGGGATSNGQTLLAGI